MRLSRTLGRLIQARLRRDQRDEYLAEVRPILADLVERGGKLEPFEHGTVFGQIRHELNTVEIEKGGLLAADRRARRVNGKVKATVRRRIYRRDDFTCQECGWRSPRDPQERIREARQERFLTIDHIVPLGEGGTNHQDNLQTCCSWCNRDKGKRLPDLEDVA